MRSRHLMAAVLALTLATVTLSTTSAADAALPSAGCEHPPAEPGDHEHVNDFDGAAQRYFVIVPPGYEDIIPAPLYVLLGSGGGDPDLNYAGHRDIYDDEPMLIAIVGTSRAVHQSPDTLLALIDQIADDYCIDERRVHVSGSSSSASAAAQLACDGSRRIASFSDGFGWFGPRGCDPERAVPLVAWTGDPDRSQVQSSVLAWADLYGCTGEPLVEDLGSGVVRSTYQGCDAEVILYDIVGLGHAVPMHECVGPFAETYCKEYEEVDGFDEEMRFFEEHPLPE